MFLFVGFDVMLKEAKMHAYIVLKKMYIVAQRKTICRYRIFQSSYTWKEPIGTSVVQIVLHRFTSQKDKLCTGVQKSCACI